MKRLLSLLLVLMLVMGALAGCGQSSKQEANNNTPQQNNTPQPSEEKVYQRNETLYYEVLCGGHLATGTH